MTLGAAWRGVRDLFRRANLASPEADARYLAELAFGVDRLELVTREREPAEPEALKRFQLYAERRLRGEPVDRIRGEKEFWGLPFVIQPSVLSPRPETEMLVRQALEALQVQPTKRLLDLGTGSGCIAISVLVDNPQAEAVAIDLSAEALRVANANAVAHGVKERLDTRQGSWFEPLNGGETFDAIVSNPPYIASAEIPGLQVEVRDFDPLLALDGGTDGLTPYRAIVSQATLWLAEGGTLAVEIGAGQADAVRAMFEDAGFQNIRIERDLAGLERTVSGTHPFAAGLE